VTEKQRALDAVQRLPEDATVEDAIVDPGLREVLWRNYRIVYRVARGRVEVVTVFHGSRLFLVDE
jgi:plasmid stabilization system protein ParE